jgi:hypothetical protein
MKKLLIGLTLLLSISSSASTEMPTEIKHGGKLVFSFDPSAMFQNSGDRFVIGIDWERIEYVLTNGKTKFERSFCARQLAASYKSISSVEDMKNDGVIEGEIYQIHSLQATKNLQRHFGDCVAQLGIKDAKNVNNTVLVELNIGK